MSIKSLLQEQNSIWKYCSASVWRDENVERDSEFSEENLGMNDTDSSSEQSISDEINEQNICKFFYAFVHHSKKCSKLGEYTTIDEMQLDSIYSYQTS